MNNNHDDTYADDLGANRALLDEVSRAFRRGQGCEPTFKSEGDRLRYWKAKSELLCYVYDRKAEDLVEAESKVAELTRLVEDKKGLIAETIAEVQAKPERPSKPNQRQPNKTADTVMQEELERDPEAKDWSLSTWHTKTGYSEGAIQHAPTWRSIMKARDDAERVRKKKAKEDGDSR